MSLNSPNWGFSTPYFVFLEENFWKNLAMAKPNRGA